MESGQSSQTHRHNFSETVLFFLGGEATVFINDTPHAVSAGDRVLIHNAEYHSVATSAASGCSFLSVQPPPLLSTATGFRDTEGRGGGAAGRGWRRYGRRQQGTRGRGAGAEGGGRSRE